MKTIVKKTICALAMLALVSIPSNAFSASISASSSHLISAGDTSIVGVYLNTEGQTINTIDGTLTLSDQHGGNFEVKELSLAQSQVPLWPRKPSLDSSGSISFVGGIPGGISGERILLFSVVVKINDSGTFTISPKSINVFIHDGVGTKVSVANKSSSIEIGTSKKDSKDEWKEIVSNDNNAPDPFVIELMQDPNLFDGKKFISFETKDAETGVWYYEVKEGNNPPVRTGTQYVLIDQVNPVDLTVTAYDKAGNFQVAYLAQKMPLHWLSIAIAIAILCVVYFIFKLIRRKRKNAQKVI